MDERRLTAMAGELGMSAEELRAVVDELTAGVPEAVLGGLIRFEDALFELSQ